MRTPLPQVRGAERLHGDKAVAERLASIFRLVEDDHQVSISGIHGLHPYPGRMHPLWARRALKGLPAESVVMDPFCGGGTALIEARRHGLRALGSDINPVAVRLARIRTNRGPSAERLRAEAQRCAEDCATRRHTPFSSLASGEKRLPRHVLAGLISLRDEIEKTEDPHVREVLLMALSPLIDKFSSRRDRPAPRVSKSAVPRHFVERVERWVQAFEEMPSAPRAHVERADARWLPWDPGSVDVVISSPPYPGVLDYVGHQERRLRWLGDGPPLRATMRKEIGRRNAGDDWGASMARVFQQIVRSTRPDSLVYMIVGDGVSRGQAVYTDQVLMSLTRRLPLYFVASASQQRPHFHRPTEGAFYRRPRYEHLMLWRRTGTKASTRRGGAPSSGPGKPRRRRD